MADRNMELAIILSAKDKGASKAVRGIGADVDQLTTKLKQLAAAAGIAFSGREIIQAADEYNQLTARIKLATKGQEEFSTAQRELFEISQATRADLAATVDLYSKTADALRNIGATQQESLGFVEAINQALAISGTSGAQASGVILQLSQGLGAGALRGDEFNSVLEGSRRLMQAFADGMGVPIGKLREMAEAGELTSERLFSALSSQRAKLAAEYATFPETVAGAFQRIQNAFTRYIGDSDNQTGASRALALALTDVANNFEAVGDAALVAGGIIAAVYAGKSVTAIAATSAAAATSARQFVMARQASQALAAQEQASAAAALVHAKAQQTTAAAALVEANAHRANTAQLAIYGPVRAAAERQVAAAAAAHVAASQAVVAADARMAAASAAAAASQSSLALATRGLGAVVGFLGGPIGTITTLLTLGALAWLAWGDKAESASEKAKRATQEVGKQADEILQRLKKEGSFGTGDLAVLREQAVILEKQISVLNQSSGKSLGAAAKLKEKWTALNEVTAAIAKLEAKEIEQAGQFRTLSAGQAVDAKKLAKEMTEAIKSRIQDYELLVKKNREAWQNSLESEKEYLEQAAALRASANQTAVDTSTPQGQAEANQSLLIERMKLERLATTQGTSYEDIKAQADAVRDLTKATQEGTRAKEIMKETDIAQARGAEAAAETEKATQEGLREEWNNSQQLVEDLQAALEAIGKGTAINIQSDAAKAVLDEITAKLAAIQDKTVTVTVKTVGGNGAGLDNLSNLKTSLPGFASGGPLRGPGHATSDNLLLLGSPGEYMLQAAAVRHYGLPLIDAINSLRLPKFANGGLLSRIQPIQARQPVQSAPAGQTVNINLDLGSLGRYPMKAAPDVISELRLAALKFGGR